MVDFYPLHAYRSTDGCVYHKPRKKYTRKKPCAHGWLKIKTHPHENAAIVMIRRLGYSQNLISEFFGRSLSYINRIVKIAEMRGVIPYFSKRKLPSQVRLLSAPARRKKLTRFWAAWISFIFGEADKPP